MQRIISLLKHLSLQFIGIPFSLLFFYLPAEPSARSYQRPNNQSVSSVIAVSDGFLLSGSDSLNGPSVSGWLMKTNFSGEVLWARETNDALFQNLIQLPGDGIVAAGSSPSLDLMLARLNADGDSQWVKSFVDSEAINTGSKISQTPDGGYFIAGQINPIDDATNSNPWALKVDSDGNLQWQRLFDAEGMQDLIIGGEPTADGGYIIAALQNFKQSGAPAIWLIKLNQTGNRVWEKAFTINGLRNGTAISETTDGGFIISATRFEAGKGEDLLILKLNASGNVVWQKGYGGNLNDAGEVYPVLGGYLVIGATDSFGAGNADVWVFKLDLQGNILWQRAFGGTDDDNGQAFATHNGRYLVAGQTRSFGSDGSDIWLLNLDENGNASGDCSIAVDTTAVPYITSGSIQNFSGTLPAYSIAASDAVMTYSEWSPLISTQCCSLTLTPAQLPAGAENQIYSNSVAVLEDTEVTYSITSDALPPGLSLDPVTGLISGIPTTTGLFNFEITALDNLNCAATKAYTIQIVQCIFCDDFEDGVLSSQWTYPKGTWQEQNCSLMSAPARKASAIAQPAFNGCSVCTVRTSFVTTGGGLSRIWINGWHQDKNNQIELLIKENQNKWVLRHRAGGRIVAKKKWTQAIEPGVQYEIAIIFTGIDLNLQINGVNTISLRPNQPISGTVGFQLKATTAEFGYIIVD